MGVELYNWNLSPCPSPWQLQSNVSGLGLTRHIYVPSECSQSGRTAPRMAEAMTGFRIALEKKRQSEEWREEKKNEWVNESKMFPNSSPVATYTHISYMLYIKIEEAFFGLCCGLCYSLILRMIFRTINIVIFTVIVLGVNRPLNGFSFAILLTPKWDSQQATIILEFVLVTSTDCA